MARHKSRYEYRNTKDDKAISDSKNELHKNTVQGQKNNGTANFYLRARKKDDLIFYPDKTRNFLERQERGESISANDLERQQISDIVGHIRTFLAEGGKEYLISHDVTCAVPAEIIENTLDNNPALSTNLVLSLLVILEVWVECVKFHRHRRSK